MLSEQEFRHAADRALDETLRALVPLADREGFDVDRQHGILRLTFDRPASMTFIVNAHAPARQIWVSAQGRDAPHPRRTPDARLSPPPLR